MPPTKSPWKTLEPLFVGIYGGIFSNQGFFGAAISGFRPPTVSAMSCLLLKEEALCSPSVKPKRGFSGRR